MKKSKTKNAASAGQGPTGFDRRRFLKGAAMGLCLGPLARGFTARGAGADLGGSVCAAPASRLSGSDFTYLGHYDVALMGMNTPFAHALTHRYVGGDLRFLTVENGEPTALLREWSVSGKKFGDLVSSATGAWNDPWGNKQPLNGNFFGLWWDELRKRLWSVHAFDYTYDVIQTQIYTRTLNADGSVSDLHGPVGLSGISAKRVYGGVQPVPEWFQQKYAVGPYVVGWGGYTSISRGGGICSFGPTMYGIPDPSRYAPSTEMPTTDFRTIMDCSSGTSGTDWYKNTTQTFDRGVRQNIPINYYDGGDPRSNPTTAPTDPPVANAGWLSPAPDGLGRFVWGDSYYNTGCWIDGPNKQGFLAVASLGAGKNWYGNATLNCDSRVFELHIFDPSDLGEAAQGRRAPWNVKPSSMLTLQLPGIGGRPFSGNSPQGGVAGATYDALTKRLYLFGPAGGGTYVNRLYVYAVNA